MNYLTLSEHRKIHEITQRLENLQSPVLRLQAILQFSMIVDTLAIGDSAQPMISRMGDRIQEIDDLQNKLDRYEEQAESETKLPEHERDDESGGIGSSNECAERDRASVARGASATVEPMGGMVTGRNISAVKFRYILTDTVKIWAFVMKCPDRVAVSLKHSGMVIGTGFSKISSMKVAHTT
jgi:hypothetical protein